MPDASSLQEVPPTPFDALDDSDAPPVQPPRTTVPHHTSRPAKRNAAAPSTPAPAHRPLAQAAHDPTGHRARLRQRLLHGGDDALADHELLEYLLMLAIPRRDTKPVARTLLARYGSLAAALNADVDALAGHPGMGDTSAAALRIVAVTARRLARTMATEAPVLSSWSALIAYLTIDMAHLTVERVRVLYLDTKFRLIRDEHVCDGSLDEAAIHPREVLRRALDVGAASLIIVHNHPSGSPEPSKADIQVTVRIAEAARLLNIAVHDHVIIGKEGHVSLRSRGLV
ncbi:DNA repair protein RadC [Novosphingobium sp. FSY-8]|uniref:DNA repair protein RadC n=1 Tax=Novosphingobium ovatum TaxID=1908523 RepID=A0ABW9XBL3_9SPHN|nr:DNA repair protein RadC [Novosphingobium ovatum]NBC35897.1 DNA repair protein RadC [Novosphingobium ovatum]